MIKRKLDLKIKQWRIKEGNQGVFINRVVHEADWIAQDDPNTTQNKLINCIKRVAKNVLGESWGGALPCKDILWWNEEVKVVTPRSQRYGDVMATYIREVKTRSRVR